MPQFGVDRRAIRIAMIGSRGMPAKYGGVETVVAVAARELARRGHHVTVFCRRSDYDERPRTVDGVRLVYLWAPSQAGVAALIHSLLATLWIMPRRFEVVHYHALGPGLLAVLPRALKRRTLVVQTIHGRDDKRAKWGGFSKAVLRLGAASSARVPHETLVVSHALRREYLADFNRHTRVVPNATGAVPQAEPGSALGWFNLEPGNYVVSVGRIVPEKAPHEIVEAFVGSDLDTKLVIIGGSAGTEDYRAELEACAGDDDRVVFTGPVYGEELAQLMAGASCFVTASHLEGLPTALIEAGRRGLPCLASDIDPHCEILGAGGPGRRTFITGDADDFIGKLRKILAEPAVEQEGATVLASDLDRRFSLARAADAHEAAYGLIDLPVETIDLRDSVDEPTVDTLPVDSSPTVESTTFTSGAQADGGR